MYIFLFIFDFSPGIFFYEILKIFSFLAVIFRCVNQLNFYILYIFEGSGIYVSCVGRERVWFLYLTVCLKLNVCLNIPNIIRLCFSRIILDTKMV